MLKNIPLQERAVTLFFGWCNDAAVFKRFKEESFSPWVMECLNIDPKNRYTFACLFFVALLPPSVKSYNRLYGHVLEQLHAAGAFTGFQVTDENGQTSTLKIKLTRKVIAFYVLYCIMVFNVIILVIFFQYIFIYIVI